MPTTAVLLRGAALLFIVMPMTTDSTNCRPATEKNGTAMKAGSVKITADASAVAGCKELREIDLSGNPEQGNDARVADDRDAILKSIAAEEGGDAVLILKRTRQFVQARAFRCRGAGELGR
jgi:hypothetical protein